MGEDRLVVRQDPYTQIFATKRKHKHSEKKQDLTFTCICTYNSCIKKCLILGKLASLSDRVGHRHVLLDMYRILTAARSSLRRVHTHLKRWIDRSNAEKLAGRRTMPCVACIHHQKLYPGYVDFVAILTRVIFAWTSYSVTFKEIQFSNMMKQCIYDISFLMHQCGNKDPLKASKVFPPGSI